MVQDGIERGRKGVVEDRVVNVPVVKPGPILILVLLSGSVWPSGQIHLMSMEHSFMYPFTPHL